MASAARVRRRWRAIGVGTTDVIRGETGFSKKALVAQIPRAMAERVAG